MTLRGRAFVFGDRIDTDLLAPGPYMREPIDVLASHCLEAIDPGFAREARPGDVVLVAGKGHEPYQEIAGRMLHFDDRETVREAIAEGL